MKRKTFLIEIFILAASVLLVRILVVLFGRPQLDINLHDTYLVFSENIVGFPVLLLIFFIYIIKEAFYKYKRRLQNIILLLSLFFINIEVSKFIGSLAVMSKKTSQFNGWTIYPPLSASSSHQPIMAAPQPNPFVGITQIIFYLQIFLVALLVILAIVTGKNWNSNKNVS
ncbi:hypothetical protein [Mucilaginibacter xinganensis]|uniref:hypothetical protein n=1 Tax=Mucilaginibacter xinganensis TaxID=1234841 RepID=UPI000B99C242|nr:hypothetical protein [Mucilaginibacter xinganensis]